MVYVKCYSLNEVTLLSDCGQRYAAFDIVLVGWVDGQRMD
jgi:hypothetical protein